MTDHTPMSKVSRLEVVAAGARRCWTFGRKTADRCRELRQPRLVSVTARRNGLSASQLFTWRRLAREIPQPRQVDHHRNHRKCIHVVNCWKDVTPSRHTNSKTKDAREQSPI